MIAGGWIDKIELTGRCIEKARAILIGTEISTGSAHRLVGGFRTWLGYGYLGKLMDAREADLI